MAVARLALALLLAASCVPAATVAIGTIGLPGPAFEALRACERELDVRLVRLGAEAFTAEPPRDLADLDLILASFGGDQGLRERYRRSIADAVRRNPRLRVFCLGPPQIHQTWVDWLGAETARYDPAMAGYYGLSAADLQNMLRYALVTHCGRQGEVPPPPATATAVRIFHPAYGQLDSIARFRAAAQADGWDMERTPRVAIGAFRHHLAFHQPQVVEALIRGFAARRILAVCLIADDPGFQQRLLELAPALVVMTSHTFEPAPFWERLDVPRLHAVWFLDESIARWRESRTTGMGKVAIQHLYGMAEARGATECLTSGGTDGGGRNGDEVLPIADRIDRIVGRAQAWIRLRTLGNAEKRVAIIGYDHHADKAGLLSGQQLGLNAPRSLVALLRRLRAAGYGVEDVPADEGELLARLLDHGRQMGAGDAAALDRLARSGTAALVPAEAYRGWYERKVPARERAEVERHWGPPPGAHMVWRSQGREYLVLPKLDLGRVVLATQPPKGEALTATAGAAPEAGLLPPTHHFLATYFWLQEEFRPDAVIHFGAHGNEWLFPGKQAAISGADWSDILIADLPNINPWMANNTSEVLPCRRRAYAVTIDHLPPLLMRAGLGDDLLNLESTIGKYLALEDGALRTEFADAIARQARACRLDRELTLPWTADGGLAEAGIRRIADYLHDRQNEAIPAGMHVLGEKPEDRVLLPYLVLCMGPGYLEAARPLFDLPDEEIGRRTQAALRSILRAGRPAAEALREAGARIGDGGLPAAVRAGLDLAVGLDAGLERTDDELAAILRALSGRFIAPGPSGAPERNPGVVPTGRNMFVHNPEELPARSSWDLGTRLIREHLAAQHRATGTYPRKIAFGLIPYATYGDYGVIESQILYLLGVRPVWDAKGRVRDLEVIPRHELGRPRIDVFLSAKSVYRDELPDMMRLLDRAVRMVAALDEPGNTVHANAVRMRRELEAGGVPSARAALLAGARMYGTRPEETVDGHDWYFYLAERTGAWDDRDQLLDAYLSRCKNVYTDGLWGVPAPEAFAAAVQGTELILRSWYDGRDTVLADKFAWWSEGSLSLAIKRITGTEPAYLLADVRNPGQAALVDAEQAMRRDLRTRLLAPAWIRMLMGEGYDGAGQIAKHVSNLMGWKVMRDGSVSDADWVEVMDVYVRDRAGLGLRDWFDRQNPYAFQGVTATMIETARKGFWSADAATLGELVAAYADSVVRHGRGGGLREAGNAKLHDFVQRTLAAAGDADSARLLAGYRAALAADAAEPVHGNRLEPVAGRRTPAGGMEPAPSSVWLPVAAAGLLLVLLGFLLRGRHL